MLVVVVHSRSGGGSGGGWFAGRFMSQARSQREREERGGERRESKRTHLYTREAASKRHKKDRLVHHSYELQ